MALSPAVHAKVKKKKKKSQRRLAEKPLKISMLQLQIAHLSSSGVGVNRNLAGASPMAVDCGGHFLSVKQCNNFLLGRNKFSGLSLLQRLTNEMGKHFDFCAWEQLLNPEETEKESEQ